MERERFRTDFGWREIDFSLASSSFVRMERSERRMGAGTVGRSRAWSPAGTSFRFEERESEERENEDQRVELGAAAAAITNPVGTLVVPVPVSASAATVN